VHSLNQFSCSVLTGQSWGHRLAGARLSIMPRRGSSGLCFGTCFRLSEPLPLGADITGRDLRHDRLFLPRLTQCIVRAKASRQLTAQTQSTQRSVFTLRFRRLGGECLKRDRRWRVPTSWERPNIFRKSLEAGGKPLREQASPFRWQSGRRSKPESLPSEVRGMLVGTGSTQTEPPQGVFPSKERIRTRISLLRSRGIRFGAFSGNASQVRT